MSEAGRIRFNGRRVLDVQGRRVRLDGLPTRLGQFRNVDRLGFEHRFSRPRKGQDVFDAVVHSIVHLSEHVEMFAVTLFTSQFESPEGDVQRVPKLVGNVPRELVQTFVLSLEF